MANEVGETTGLEALFDRAERAATARTVPESYDPFGLPVIVRSVIPDNYSAEYFDLEQYANAPRRKKGTVAFDRVESLIEYMVDQGNTAGNAMPNVYAREGRFVVVLNDHTNAGPGWGDHRAVFRLRVTPAWKAWVEADGTWQTQEEFAEFLEDRIGDIVAPDGATLMEIATTLRVKSTLDFQSNVRLSNGQVQLTYVEDIQGTAGTKGDLLIPERLSLAIAPFDGVAPVKLDARFRWRVVQGKAKFHYTLGEKIIEVTEFALTEAAGKIKDGTGISVMYGEAAAPQS